jgi:hypothetical protein
MRARSLDVLRVNPRRLAAALFPTFAPDHVACLQRLWRKLETSIAVLPVLGPAISIRCYCGETVSVSDLQIAARGLNLATAVRAVVFAPSGAWRP